MKYRSKVMENVMKKLCCLLATAMVASIATSGAYALTQGQKSIGDIGADITWYDFGDTYTSYYINDDLETGFYALTMSDGSTISKTGFVNAKGELALEPVAYGSFSGSVGGGGSVFGIKTGDGNYTYIDSDGIKVIDGTAYRTQRGQNFLAGRFRGTGKYQGLF